MALVHRLLLVVLGAAEMEVGLTLRVGTAWKLYLSLVWDGGQEERRHHRGKETRLPGETARNAVSTGCSRRRWGCLAWGKWWPCDLVGGTRDAALPHGFRTPPP